MTPRTWLAVLGVLTAVVLPLAGCTPKPTGDIFGNKPGLHVLTSFAPVYCLVASVAGEDADVKTILTEQGPHDYEATAQDAAKLRGANLFFIIGLDLDDGLAKKMMGSAGNVTLVELGEGLPKELLRPMAHEHDHDANKKDEKKEHEHGEHDPHVWLGVPQCVAMVGRIRDDLKKADPAHAAGYDRRAAETVARLQAIQEVGKAKLKDKTEKRFISFHESLGYFAPSFGLQIVASIEPKAGVEPSPQWMSELIALCKKEKVRVIATEPQYSSNNAAQTILRELKRNDPSAAFVEIDPVETAPTDALKPDYLERKLKENVDRLADTLK